MHNKEVIAYVDWLTSQNIADLREVVLKYPRFDKLEMWDMVLEKTFREFDQTYLKGDIKRKNVSYGSKYIRRLVIIGGNEECAIPYHAHCLVDCLGSDEDLFLQALTKAWTNNVRKYLKIYTNRVFHKHLIDVYFAKLKRPEGDYILYTTRYEGNEFATRPDKVCVAASYLLGWEDNHSARLAKYACN